jgi:uncharacterized membrane protein
MTLKRYRLIEAIVLVIVAVLVGWSVASGNPWLPLPIFAAGIVIGLCLRKGVKKLAVDERVNSIAEKSMSVAAAIFTILAAPVGLTLIALGRNGQTNLDIIGYTLAFSACALILLYYSAYLYHNKKASGKEE